MAAGFVASAPAGGGQSATTTSLTITVPSTAAAGNSAVLCVEAATSTTVTLTVPSGWTLSSGPVRGSSMSAWLLTKSLVSGDIGANVTLTLSTAQWCTAEMIVSSGTTLTGMQVASANETSTTTTPTLPTLSGVASGSFLAGFINRRRGASPAVTVGAPTGYTAADQIQTNHGTFPELTELGFWQVTTSTGTAGGQAGTSSPSATAGINFLVALPASSTGGTGATVTGAVMAVSLAMPAGTASGTAATSTTSVSTYEQVWRSGGMTVYYSVKATTGGVPVQGAQDLRPIGGQIVDTNKPGVRRTLTLDLAPELINGTPLYELLTPAGTQLTVTAHCSAGSVPITDVPMGVFDVDSAQVSEGGGKVSLTAPDKWDRIRRARFLQPQSSNPGVPVWSQITTLVQGALGSSETVLNLASSTATVGALTWDRDRDKAIQDLAASMGAWIYFDRLGQCTLADIPTLGASANWLINSGTNGVLTSLDRSRTRQGAYNVVVVSSSAASGQAFPTQIVWDSDPNSPTYAGKDPLSDPGSAGPFGIVPVFYSSPILASATDAQTAGAAILSQAVGLASQVSLSGVPNPQLDAFQTIDVLPPPIPWASDRVIERHVADTVTHPLVFDSSSQPMTIAGRSTRTDPYISDVTS